MGGLGDCILRVLLSPFHRRDKFRKAYLYILIMSSKITVVNNFIFFCGINIVSTCKLPNGVNVTVMRYKV